MKSYSSIAALTGEMAKPGHDMRRSTSLCDLRRATWGSDDDLEVIRMPVREYFA
jgi:hypothetical protein